MICTFIIIMSDPPDHQIQYLSNFHELVSTPFREDINAMCWRRQLTGDFSEIVEKIRLSENILQVEPEQLYELQLSSQGQLARDIILKDLDMLKHHGASPVLNVIRHYDRDEGNTFFPTDVYSFHADRSPVPTDTFLCTYYGAPSDILPNSQCIQKVLVPEIRHELRKQYGGADEGFESFLSEHFFDLHYQAKPGARPMSLGLGHLWKLAVDHPQSQVLPCIHRAPVEKAGEHRLLLIC